jgi:hypothetical protein
MLPPSGADDDATTAKDGCCGARDGVEAPLVITAGWPDESIAFRRILGGLALDRR